MPLLLVQELDAAFSFISLSKDVFLKAKEYDQILQELEELDNEPRERVDQFSLEIIKEVEEGCREAVKNDPWILPRSNGHSYNYEAFGSSSGLRPSVEACRRLSYYFDRISCGSEAETYHASYHSNCPCNNAL